MKTNLKIFMLVIAMCVVVGCSKTTSQQPSAASAANTAPAVNVALASSIPSSLSSLFVDLSGWTGKNAEQMKSQEGGVSINNTAREYKNGDKLFAAVLSVGMPTKGLAGDNKEDVIDNEAARIETKTIDGFKTLISLTKADKSGSILVFLNGEAERGAIIGFSFQKMDEDEAINLSKKFNWKAMKKAAEGM